MQIGLLSRARGGEIGSWVAIDAVWAATDEFFHTVIHSVISLAGTLFIYACDAFCVSGA